MAGGILASGAVMLLRVVVLTGLINWPLGLKIAPALMAAALVSGALALASGVVEGQDRHARRRACWCIKNPFDLQVVLRFGALLAVVMLAAGLARRYVGDQGLFAVAGLSGLADVDALILSVARTAAK